MVATLPGIALTWSASALSDAEFHHYNIKRKLTTESTYVTIARITTKATTSFTDYAVKSGVAYDYAITQVTPIGTESVSATDTNNTATFSNTFLHDAVAPTIGGTPTYCAFVRGPFGVDIQDVRDQERLLPFNSAKPVVHLGVALYRQATVRYAWMYKSISSENEAAVQLPLLQTLLEDGQTLCLRTGTGELMYCQIESSGHGISAPFVVSPTIQLVEVDWEENLDLVS